jgi:hypothetical protein
VSKNMSMGSKVAPSSASITGFKLKVRTFSFLSQHQTRTTPSCPFKPFNSPFNSNLKLINLFLILSTSDALKRTNFFTPNFTTRNLHLKPSHTKNPQAKPAQNSSSKIYNRSFHSSNHNTTVTNPIPSFQTITDP